MNEKRLSETLGSLLSSSMDDVIDPFSELPDRLLGGVIGIGNFEGVHRGHCRLLAKLRSRARELGGPAVAVSFDPLPAAILRPSQAPVPLMTPRRKIQVLKASGCDGVAVMQTTPRLLSLSAEEFFESIILGRFQARGLVEGRNFFYGKGRAGNIETLKEATAKAGLSFDVVDIVTGEGEHEVSSTRIRREISNGQVTLAERLLGRPHRIEGIVTTGDRRGSQLGFPTANIEQITVLLPAPGVYAGRTAIDGQTYPVACNIGPNPTFGIDALKVEAHVIDYSGDLYGARLGVDLLEWIRPVRRFQTVEELKEQIEQDVAECRRASAGWSCRYGSDLGQTITMWLQSEWGPTLGPSGASLHATLDAVGQLTIGFSVPVPSPPTVSMELLLRGEERLRRVFPEIRSLRWDSSGSDMLAGGSP